LCSWKALTVRGEGGISRLWNVSEDGNGKMVEERTTACHETGYVVIVVAVYTFQIPMRLQLVLSSRTPKAFEIKAYICPLPHCTSSTISRLL
jgi:hypothetical protein